MKAYINKISDRWYGYIQTPLGLWVPLERWAGTDTAMRDYLKSLGFEVIPRP